MKLIMENWRKFLAEAPSRFSTPASRRKIPNIPPLTRGIIDKTRKIEPFHGNLSNPKKTPQIRKVSKGYRPSREESGFARVSITNTRDETVGIYINNINPDLNLLDRQEDRPIPQNHLWYGLYRNHNENPTIWTAPNRREEEHHTSMMAPPGSTKVFFIGPEDMNDNFSIEVFRLGELARAFGAPNPEVADFTAQGLELLGFDSIYEGFGEPDIRFWAERHSREWEPEGPGEQIPRQEVMNSQIQWAIADAFVEKIIFPGGSFDWQI